MSYRYDETTKRYVLNTSYVSTPTNSGEAPTPDGAKTAREPVVFRISSKSRMSSFEEAKPETAVNFNLSAETPFVGQSLPVNAATPVTVVDNLNSGTIKIGFREDRSLNAKSHTALNESLLSGGSLTDRASNNHYQQSSFRKDNAVQNGVATAAPPNSPRNREQVTTGTQPSSVRSNVVKLSMGQPTRFTVSSESTNNQPIVRNQPLKISELTKMHEAQLQDYHQTRKEQERKEQQRRDHERKTQGQQEQQRRLEEERKQQQRAQMEKVEQEKKQWLEHMKKQRQRNELDRVQHERKEYERKQSEKQEQERKERQRREVERREHERKEQEKRDQIRLEYEQREQQRRKDQQRREQERQEREKRDKERREQQRRDREVQLEQQRARLSNSYVSPSSNTPSQAYATSMNNSVVTPTATTPAARQPLHSSVSSAQLYIPTQQNGVNTSDSRQSASNSQPQHNQSQQLNGANNLYRQQQRQQQELKQLEQPQTATNSNSQSLNASFSSPNIRPITSYQPTTRDQLANQQNASNQQHQPSQQANNLQSGSQPPTSQPTTNNYNLQQQLQERISRLEEENGNLRAELRRLSNDSTLSKSKISSMEANSKHELEHLQKTNRVLDEKLKDLEQMKRDIEVKLTNRMTAPVSELAKRVERIADEHRTLTDNLRNRDIQLANMQADNKVKDEELKALRGMVRALEDGNQHMRIDNEKERKTYLETCRNLEEGKAQLRRLKEELSRNNYQGIWESNETNKQRIQELTRELDEAKLQVRRAKEEGRIQAHQKAQDEAQATQRKIVELTRECEQLRTKSYELERNVQLAESKLMLSSGMNSTPSSANVSRNNSFSNLHKVVECPEESDVETLKQLRTVENHLEREKASNARLTKMVNELNTQVNAQNLNLAKFKGDFNTLTYLHASKEKEVVEVRKKMEVAEMKHNESLRQLETQVELLESKLEEKEEEYKSEFKQLRRELKEARSEWCDRILTSGPSFDDALKELLQQIESLKRKLAAQEEHCISLKEKLWASESQLNNLNSELKLERLKSAGDRKTLEMDHELALQDVASELTKAQRLADSLGNKVKQLSDQNKGKDIFIVKTLMGRQLAEHDKLDLEDFFRQYQEVVPVRDHKKKLEQELLRIDELEESNRQLVRDLARKRP